ncbi:MAG TPA: hypothetical protein VMF06_02790 [Candidatus Limnocylindria bacterium]|nr:hypothetical protein [Candidatus Limnocylindria bacterium]
MAEEPTNSPGGNPLEPYGPDLQEFENLKSPGRFLGWASLILVIGIGVGLALFPIYRATKAHRARSLAKQGEEFLAAGKINEAMEKVHTAIAFGPSEPEVLRLTARSLTALRSPEALSYWEILASDPGATLSDQLDLVRTALVFARFEAARRTLERLYDHDANNPEVLGLGIAYFRATGNLNKALEAARQLLEVPNISDATKIAGAEVLAVSPVEGDVLRGQKILLELAKQDGPAGRGARSALVELRSLPEEDARRLLVQLTNTALPSLTGQLRTAELWERLYPTATNEICDWYQSRLGTEPPATDEIIMIAGWWLGQRRPDFLLKWVPETRSNTNADWLVVRIQALAFQKKWGEVATILDNTNNVLNPFQRDVFRTLNLWSQGDTQNAQRLLTILASEAQNHPERLLLLASAAENVGARSMAVEAWRDLSRLPAMQLAAGIRAMQAAKRLGDARTIVDVYRDFLKIVPSDYGVRAEIVYYRLLLGDPVSEVGRQLQLLPQAILESDRGQALLAMQALREGDMDVALTRIEAPHFDWPQVAPRWQLLYATILAANHQKELARSMTAKLNPDDFLPVERQFANNWLPVRL